MSKQFSGGHMEFNLTPGGAVPGGKPKPETPFRILIMGDFSGRGNRGVQEGLTAGSGRGPFKIDIDNFDEVMGKLSPKLCLPVAGEQGGVLSVGFAELDDFDPDQLFARLEIFSALGQTRKKLLDPSTFAHAAAEVGQWSKGASSASGDEPGGAKASGEGDKAGKPGGDDMFERLLGQPQTPSSRITTGLGTVDLGQMIEQIVGPHVVAGPDPKQGELVAAVDAGMSKQMRTVLHDPGFRGLEGSWRALDFLVHNLETDEQLQLYVLDVSKEELASDLASGDDLRLTGIYRLLVEQTVGTPGGEPWAVVVGDYTFEASVQDAQMLGRVGTVMSQSGAPFIGGASAGLLGCESLAQTPSPEDWKQAIDAEVIEIWQGLRKLPESVYLGLALPGFLLRLPYGRDTDAIDRFDFEELAGDLADGLYLWGNGAYLCGYLLGQSFTQDQWGFTPGGGLLVSGLPVHSYKVDGESMMTPCAQAWLTDRGAQAILSKGLMPVMSVRGRDAVQLVRFQSLSDPAKNLAGRWG